MGVADNFAHCSALSCHVARVTKASLENLSCNHQHNSLTSLEKQQVLQMESSLVSYTVSEAHPETLDYLSSAWCKFALQTLQENTLPLQPEGSLVLVTDSSPSLTAGSANVNILTPSPSSANFHGQRMDEETDILPPWKSNDLKSWIWMQQALHPELNYKNTYFDTKRWFTWRTSPLKNGIKPIKKWLEDMKQKRKEENRLKRAEVHGAISIAGVAAALAAIAAAENLKAYEDKTSKESVVASAAALVASRCAEMASAMGATKEQLSTVLASAKTATNATDILTLTAAAATSIRGVDRLKARKQSLNRMINGRSIKETEEDDDDDFDFDFDFEYGRSLLSKGALINTEKINGKSIETWVSVDLNSKAEVIMKMKKLTNMFKLKTYSTKKESVVVMDLHVELYSDPEDSYTTCYLIVLATSRGMIKLDMSNDYARYKMWMSTVKRMLMISVSPARVM